MTAFLKIDRCALCGEKYPWDWIPPLTLAGRQLAGTGVWRTALVDGACGSCWETRERERRQRSRLEVLRAQFIRLVGGSKPYREFTFARYDVTSGNRHAVQCAHQFNPSKDNLYVWGGCGVGKTHLAVALLRRWFLRGSSAAMVTPAQLIRKLRMQTPEIEQHSLDAFIRLDVLVIDDLGNGFDTAYGRQILQEILDGRYYNDRGGLIVTCQRPLVALAQRLGDRAITSRLVAMCEVLEITGPDQRPSRRMTQTP